MSLKSLQSILQQNLTPSTWAEENEVYGSKVAKFRRYQDGNHDAQMTAEMRNALRVASGQQNAPFNSNQMDDVITTMSDRLTVDRITGDTDPANEWSKEVLDFNRFDGLQMDVHESTVRDGRGYVLVEFDKTEDMPIVCHEMAWDGSNGMLVVYESNDKHTVAVAIKVWCESKAAYGDTVRANVYYPERIERWISEADKFIPYMDEEYPIWPFPWTMTGKAGGEPLGIPVIEFRNGSRGMSELQNATPLQDALNRTLHSMVMTGELSAFPVMVATGFQAPAAVTPGMIVSIGTDGIPADQTPPTLVRIPGSDLTQYIDMANFFIGRIEAVTRTPNMQTNSNLSGEAMKQSEIKLIGKVKRAQVTMGNAWEDVMAMCARVQKAYGTKSPPESKHWKTEWADAEIRNDKDVVANAMLVSGIMGDEQTLRNLAGVYQLDEDEIQTILKTKRAAGLERLQSLQTQVNPFGGLPRQLVSGINQQMMSNGVSR